MLSWPAPPALSGRRKPDTDGPSGRTRFPRETKQQLKRGTVGRIAGYARPYRWELAIFLLAAALDAVITVTIPVRGAAAADRGDGRREVLLREPVLSWRQVGQVEVVPLSAGMHHPAAGQLLVADPELSRRRSTRSRPSHPVAGPLPMQRPVMCPL